MGEILQMISPRHLRFRRESWFKQGCLGAWKASLPAPAHLTLKPRLSSHTSGSSGGRGILGSPWPCSCCPPASGHGQIPSALGGGRGDSSQLPPRDVFSANASPGARRRPSASDTSARTTAGLGACPAPTRPYTTSGRTCPAPSSPRGAPKPHLPFGGTDTETQRLKRSPGAVPNQ